MTKLQGRVAIVTGAARGMGASHAELLASEGAKVIATDVVAPTEPYSQDNIVFRQLDVANKAQWAECVRFAEAQFGPVSILVNNAGIFMMGSIEEMEERDFRRVMDINQVGTFLGMQAIIASMRRAGGGSIVNISSTAGFAGNQLMAAYVSSKFAVRGMTKVAALEFGKDNVRVNSIHPGGVATPMTAGAGVPNAIPIPRFAESIEVSKMVLFLASDDSSYSTGSEFVIDGGYLAVVGQATM